VRSEKWEVGSGKWESGNEVGGIETFSDFRTEHLKFTHRELGRLSIFEWKKNSARSIGFFPLSVCFLPPLPFAFIRGWRFFLFHLPG
jgi:hypothetical protein